MSMMDILGGGGSPMGGGGQMGSDPSQGYAVDPSMSDPSGASSPTDGPGWLRQAIQDVMEYMNVEKDDIDLADASNVLSKLQTILARQQKEQEQALGVSPAVKMMRRQGG